MQRSPRTKNPMAGDAPAHQRVKFIIPLMRDYIDSYASQPPNAETATVASAPDRQPSPHHHPATSTPAVAATTDVSNIEPVHPLRHYPLRAHHRERRRTDGGPSTVLGSAKENVDEAAYSASIHPGNCKPPRRGQPLTKCLPKPDIQRSAVMTAWRERFPLVGGTMLVSQWSALLLEELNELVPHEAPKPHTLRSQAAMYVLEAACRHAGISPAFWADIEASMYVAHTGRPEDDGTHGRSSQSTGHPIPKQFAFEALQDAKVQRAVLLEKTVSALNRQDFLSAELVRLAASERTAVVRQNFAAWRCYSRQATLLRTALDVHKQKHEMRTLKIIAFRSWKLYVSISRVEAELERQDMNIQRLKEQAHADLASQAAQFRKQLDVERRVHDELVVDLRAQQYTAEERKAHDERLARLKHLEATVKEARKGSSSLEQQLKDLIVFKEQTTSVLRSMLVRLISVARVSMESKITGGIRASDVVAAALKFESGGTSRLPEFLVTSSSTSSGGLDVVQLPIACSGAHMLLSWFNTALVAHKLVPASQPLITAIGVELSDCSLYAVMLKFLDPSNPVAIQLATVEDFTTRAHMFLAALNDLLVSSSSSSSSQSSQGRSGGRASLRWTPLHLAAVHTDSFLRGNYRCHATVLACLMVLYHRSYIPFVVDKAARGTPLAQMISAPSTSDAELIESITASATSTEDYAELLQFVCNTIHYIKSTASSWNLILHHVWQALLGQESLCNPLTDAARGPGAATVAVLPNFAAHDIAGTDTAALLLTLDQRVAWFSVRGTHAMNALASMGATATAADVDRSDSNLATTTSPGWSPSAPSAAPLALHTPFADPNNEEDTAHILERIAERIPSRQRQLELFGVAERYATLLADVFCAYSGGSARLRSPQCLRLLSDCGVPDNLVASTAGAPGGGGGDGSDNSRAGDGDGGGLTSELSEGGGGALIRADSVADLARRDPSSQPPVPYGTNGVTKELLIERYATPVRQSSGKALLPLAFTMLLAELAWCLAQTNLAWRSTAAATTVARSFEAFVFQYFYCRLTKPIFHDASFRGLHQMPCGPLAAGHITSQTVDTLSPIDVSSGGGGSYLMGGDAQMVEVLKVLVEAIPSLVGNASPQQSAAGPGLGKPVASSVSTSSRASNSLSLDDFVKLWKELEILEAMCTKFVVADAKQIFVALTLGRTFVPEGSSLDAALAGSRTADKKGGKAAAAASSLLSSLSLNVGLGEIAEAAAMVACFKCPSPFFSYYGRLRYFLIEKVAPSLRKKLPSLTATKL